MKTFNVEYTRTITGSLDMVTFRPETIVPDIDLRTSDEGDN